MMSRSEFLSSIVVERITINGITPTLSEAVVVICHIADDTAPPGLRGLVPGGYLLAWRELSDEDKTALWEAACKGELIPPHAVETVELEGNPRLQAADRLGKVRGIRAYAMDAPVSDPTFDDYDVLEEEVVGPTPEEREAFRAAYRNAIEVEAPHKNGNTVHCECGTATGERCEWTGSASETVTLEWMPEHLRSSHEAAGNRGTYPHNGAERFVCERSCADRLVESEHGWTRIV